MGSMRDDRHAERRRNLSQRLGTITIVANAADQTVLFFEAPDFFDCILTVALSPMDDDGLVLKRSSLNPLSIPTIATVAIHRELDPIGVEPSLASNTFDLYRNCLQKQTGYR